MDASLVLPMTRPKLTGLAARLKTDEEAATHERDDTVRGFGGWGPFDFEPPDATARPGMYQPSQVPRDHCVIAA